MFQFLISLLFATNLYAGSDILSVKSIEGLNSLQIQKKQALFREKLCELQIGLKKTPYACFGTDKYQEHKVWLENLCAVRLREINKLEKVRIIKQNLARQSFCYEQARKQELKLEYIRLNAG